MTCAPVTPFPARPSSERPVSIIRAGVTIRGLLLRETSIAKRHRLRVLGAYIGHLAAGAGMFAALLAVGAGVDLLTQWSSRLVSNRAFVPLMTVVQRLILHTDIGLLLR